jgi:uncharacterized membrane protein
MSASARSRDDSVDLLRGLVMVVMALDHVRDFFGGGLPNPTDLAATTPALFFTRWITHFCAPSFVLLAGVGAALSLGGGRSKASLSRFLLTRGLWLVLLEVTVIRYAWSFDLSYESTTFQVIWVLGVSMIVLAALIHLPEPVVALLGAAIILGHNAFDGVRSEAPLWSVLHHRARIPLDDHHRLFVMYPLIPWIGVMAVGYVLGRRRVAGRRRELACLGGAMLIAFVILRAGGWYGDPVRFASQPTAAKTVIAFLNCEKYPPSLDYLLMTLGPLLLALGLLEGGASRWLQPLVTLGRVPLFYYVAHLYLIHGVARVIVVWLKVGGFSLAGVWGVWIAAVVVLYPACAWYAALKRRRPDLTWLSYL